MAKFPDLTGDGEVTQADILKGRGVKAAKKGGLMKKKRYDEGGDVIELESKMGRNENIGDDVRARAMAAMAARESGAEMPEAEEKPKSKPKAKPKAEPKKKTSSFEGRTSPFAGKTSSFKKMAGGGVTRADGCITKGHTKGKMIKMNRGGAC
jgi:hypothetical protein